MSTESGLSAWRDRYLLENFPDGSVLLDLESGNYFRMNGPARLICEVLMAESSQASAARIVAERQGVSTEEAASAIVEISKGLITAAPTRVHPGPFSYRFEDRRYLQYFEDRPALEIAADGQSARVLMTERDISPLHHKLRVAAPKLMFLQGLTVLHASACVTGSGGLILFCGSSGAGKTTTARAFTDGGWHAFSEDLVVIKSSHPLPSNALAFADAEQKAHAWSREASARWTADSTISCRDLALTVASGPTMPIGRILFLDQARRSGNEVSLTRTTQDETLTYLLECSFLASDSSASWRRLFASAAAIAREVDAFVVSVPNGTDALSDAARRYILSSTS